MFFPQNKTLSFCHSIVMKTIWCKGELINLPRMDFDNILFVEYLGNNYKNELLFPDSCYTGGKPRNYHEIVLT